MGKDKGKGRDFDMSKLKVEPKEKTLWQKTWHFLWHDDSWLSWTVNVVLAFVLIKFIVYPLLGLMLSTSHPVVAVVSGSMYHGLEKRDGIYEMCGNIFPDKTVDKSFDNWWSYCNGYYKKIGIEEDDFRNFTMPDGFSKGDIIILKGSKPEKLEVGDVIVFQSYYRSDPIIHRIVSIMQADGKYYFTTKGDHNPGSGQFEIDIKEEQVIGKAFVKVPYLGYVKIGFVDLLRSLNIVR